MPHMAGEGLKKHEKKAHWYRLKDVFPMESGYSMFGEQGVTPYDIRQGEVGDCWFIAAASAMAERSQRLERIFVDIEEPLDAP